MANIKIKYDGEYPCLCMGHLEVWIDDKYYDFGKYCLNSGGSVYFNENWDAFVEQGLWEVDFPEGFPEIYKQSVLDEINNQIPYGCCGGCI